MAPTKSLTVLKLELQAVLFAARLREETRKALIALVQNTFTWIDSTTVLQWLNSLDKQPIFVANRVSKIFNGTSVNQWHHIASHNNTVDASTRGMSSEALQKSNWLRDPQFLRTSGVPSQPNTDVVKNINLKSHSNESCPLEKTSTLITDVFKNDFSFPFRKFSSYSKLLEILTYCMQLLLAKDTVDLEELNAEEQKLQLMISRSHLVKEKPIYKKRSIGCI